MEKGTNFSSVTGMYSPDRTSEGSLQRFAFSRHSNFMAPRRFAPYVEDKPPNFTELYTHTVVNRARISEIRQECQLSFQDGNYPHRFEYRVSLPKREPPSFTDHLRADCLGTSRTIHIIA